MDWTNADRDMTSRIVDEGQTYLDGQLRLATSADGRAAALTGVFTAAAAALMAGLIALAVAAKPDAASKYPLFLGGGIAAGLFLIAAAHCMMAILPADFWLPGNEPKVWYDDIITKKAFVEALGEEAGYIQEKIEENRAVLKRNARLFRRGAIAGICAPTVGTLVWLISSSSVWVLGH
jgi:hypothetical protein